MVKEIHTETSSLRTLKILPINLNEIVRSWIRLLNMHTVVYSPEFWKLGKCKLYIRQLESLFKKHRK